MVMQIGPPLGIYSKMFQMFKIQDGGGHYFEKQLNRYISATFDRSTLNLK